MKCSTRLGRVQFQCIWISLLRSTRYKDFVGCCCFIIYVDGSMKLYLNGTCFSVRTHVFVFDLSYVLINLSYSYCGIRTGL